MSRRWRWGLGVLAALVVLSWITGPPEPAPVLLAPTPTSTAPAPIVAPVEDSQHTESPADVPLVDVDLDRPRACAHRWWC